MKIDKKTIIILLIVLAFIFIGTMLFVLIGRDRVGPGIVMPEPSTEMKEKTAQARIQKITELYEAIGTVRPRTETRIESQVQAQVVDVMVRAGDMVKKDQVLVVLDNRQMDTRLSQSQQALQTAISYKEQAYQMFNAAQAVFNEAEADHKRIRNYFESQAATKQELERAESRFLQAGAGLKRSREAMEGATAGIRQAEEMVREAEIFMDYTMVRAPAEGKVLERLIEPGDMALPGKPLILLKTSNVLQLEAFVREGLIRNVETGATLSAVITTLDQTVTAQVEEIIPYADPKTRTFLVKASLPEMEGIYPGMYGKLLIPFKITELVLIPSGVIRRIGQLEMVRVKKGDSWEKRYIKTGKTHEGLVEVLSGLSGNEILMIGEPENERK
jgi:HlyD family secretion protein